MSETITAQRKNIDKDSSNGHASGVAAEPGTIPRPLVQANRAFLVLTIGAGLLWSPYILALPFITGAVALATKKHLIITVGQRFLNKSKDHYRLENKADQRFNQWIATTLVALSIVAFLLDWSVLGYIFGGMVILAAGIALCGFCIGCYIRYQYQQWRFRTDLPED